MKKCYLIYFIVFALCDTAFAQNFQTLKDDQTNRQVGFYQIPQQSAINSFVTGEIQNLSAFFMLNANCYYIDSTKMATNVAQPDFSSNNIFLDATLVREWDQGKLNEVSTAMLMAHQYAGLVIKKYKLKLPEEEEILLCDYIAGYYMSCRKRNLEGRNSSASDVINTSLFAMDSRRIAFTQGSKEFNDNYKRRRVFTLLDLIEAGLDFTGELQ